MIKGIYRKFNKSKYIKVYVFKSDKSMSVNYYNRKDYNPDYLVNPNHIFIHDGYSTIVKSETGAETLNPLDFNSKYNPSDFKTAISSKLIRETFDGLKTNKIDIVKIMLFANLLINAVLLFYLLKEGGII